MQSRNGDDAAGAEVTDDLYPFLRRYKDGRVERLVTSTFVPASDSPGANGVATRNVVIDRTTGVSARLFLSVGAVETTGRTISRRPVIIYFHGGGFCTGSAFSKLFHRYASSLAARATALVVSVDYRLAPENPVPAAFDDAWAAVRWVTSSVSDPWLDAHADRTRLLLAGANIAHNVLARAGTPEGNDFDVGIEGVVLLHPFFWGPDQLPLETSDGVRNRERKLFVPKRLDAFWPFLTAGQAENGDPRLDPPAEAVAALPCRRALVAVASEDLAPHRGRRYAAWLRDKGEWCREVTLVESEGEDHAFHLYRPARASAVALMDRVVEFVGGGRTTLPPDLDTAVGERGVHLHDLAGMNLHARVASTKVNLHQDIFANGSRSNKIFETRARLMARNALVIGRGTAPMPRFGLMKGQVQIL